MISTSLTRVCCALALVAAPIAACAREGSTMPTAAGSASAASAPAASIAASDAPIEAATPPADGAIDAAADVDDAISDALALEAEAEAALDDPDEEAVDEAPIDAGRDGAIDALTVDAAPDAARDAGHDAGHDAAIAATLPKHVVKDGPTVALPAVGATPEKVLAHCRTQAAQAFLIRQNFIPIGAHKAEFDATIKYRTEQYGKVDGFGLASWNPKTPESQSDNVTFMGLPVRMHHKVVPALRCAEAAIKKSCTAFPYTAEHLAGIRYKNTYRGGEVTNHLYSIAIDVDPQKNSCCGCTKPWSEAPLCKKKTASVYDKMAMPECWVKAFEKYGWYWLGHDTLQDTMHFEFLGDPMKITK